jgi:hypothetical protein
MHPAYSGVPLCSEVRKVEHSRHRNAFYALVYILSALITFQSSVAGHKSLSRVLSITCLQPGNQLINVL